MHVASMASGRRKQADSALRKVFEHCGLGDVVDALVVSLGLTFKTAVYLVAEDFQSVCGFSTERSLSAHADVMRVMKRMRKRGWLKPCAHMIDAGYDLSDSEKTKPCMAIVLTRPLDDVTNAEIAESTEILPVDSIPVAMPSKRTNYNRHFARTGRVRAPNVREDPRHVYSRFNCRVWYPLSYKLWNIHSLPTPEEAYRVQDRVLLALYGPDISETHFPLSDYEHEPFYTYAQEHTPEVLRHVVANFDMYDLTAYANEIEVHVKAVIALAAPQKHMRHHTKRRTYYDALEYHEPSISYRKVRRRKDPCLLSDAAWDPCYEPTTSGWYPPPALTFSSSSTPGCSSSGRPIRRPKDLSPAPTDDDMDVDQEPNTYSPPVSPGFTPRDLSPNSSMHPSHTPGPPPGFTSSGREVRPPQSLIPLSFDNQTSGPPRHNSTSERNKPAAAPVHRPPESLHTVPQHTLMEHTLFNPKLCGACRRSPGRLKHPNLPRLRICEGCMMECNRIGGVWSRLDNEGFDSFCRMCCRGEDAQIYDIYVCDDVCKKGFCAGCIKAAFGDEELLKVQDESTPWSCYMCTKPPSLFYKRSKDHRRAPPVRKRISTVLVPPAPSPSLSYQTITATTIDPAHPLSSSPVTSSAVDSGKVNDTVATRPYQLWTNSDPIPGEGVDQPSSTSLALESAAETTPPAPAPSRSSDQSLANTLASARAVQSVGHRDSDIKPALPISHCITQSLGSDIVVSSSATTASSVEHRDSGGAGPVLPAQAKTNAIQSSDSCSMPRSAVTTTLVESSRDPSTTNSSGVVTAVRGQEGLGVDIRPMPTSSHHRMLLPLLPNGVSSNEPRRHLQPAVVRQGKSRVKDLFTGSLSLDRQGSTNSVGIGGAVLSPRSQVSGGNSSYTPVARRHPIPSRPSLPFLATIRNTSVSNGGRGRGSSVAVPVTNTSTSMSQVGGGGRGVGDVTPVMSTLIGSVVGHGVSCSPLNNPKPSLGAGAVVVDNANPSSRPPANRLAGAFANDTGSIAKSAGPIAVASGTGPIAKGPGPVANGVGGLIVNGMGGPITKGPSLVANFAGSIAVANGVGPSAKGAGSIANCVVPVAKGADPIAKGAGLIANGVG
mmetsp:Transcript_51052/g.84776  ORF Transcript_51052/g.84776 Transcript_51052/m.84776 type:complete len:1108 (+) Transcript_51052:130-3453(+)